MALKGSCINLGLVLKIKVRRYWLRLESQSWMSRDLICSWRPCRYLVHGGMNSVVFPLLVAVSALQVFSPELKPLLRALERARYVVFVASPPISGAYGITDPKRKLIWISPLAIEMGLGRAVLIHEAVHAAQACPKGKPSTIGWPVQMSYVVDREVSGLLYRGYAHGNHELEREAFAMQGHPQAIQMISKTLQKRCR